MSKRFQGKIALDVRDSVPDWEPYLAPKAPKGSPNVLMIAWDDVGYGAMDVFGGPIQTPTMQRIANLGVRFGNFHTTALCSPTRASLLTGRNATTNGMATIAEFASGFPGISTRIPFESGFISEVLAGQGYNTYCVGKWHLTPGEECNVAAYKGRWPLGRGFERYYGWLGGETNSYYPDLVHDNHPIEPPARPEDGYHLADDLSNRAIQFIQDAKTIDPDKPFFMYFAPQAGTRASSTLATRRCARRSSPARSNSASYPRAPSCRTSTRTASPRAPGRTVRNGRCWTPSGRGRR
jgi:arylsulfatase